MAVLIQRSVFLHLLLINPCDLKKYESAVEVGPLKQIAHRAVWGAEAFVPKRWA
jgi:hypothetical protein